MIEAHALRALAIARSLGFRVAALYLKKRGWTLEETYIVLFGKLPSAARRAGRV